ncbi:hypothetical protein JAAARDRAFT_54566 [Jaapia argillacea MUCL 33604]|uniref:Uncharacterized protein n=1 Tax=Jaapia argillacea MUCL 33604 TaxID=933084 RepID=A0A067QJ45_9AGAM|nr:hypothetical protein JAAARDRAFT_54566 [Jaapia argillacea MUCL 33604]
MVTTRRKTRQSAATDGEDHAEISSQAGEDGAGATLTLTLPDDVDLESLSNLLPDFSLTSPSTDAIISLYRLVLAQVAEVDAVQRDLEDVRAESERKDVELDQALQDRETATQELDASLEAAHNELKQVKLERDDLASSQKALQAQIFTLSSSQSASSTEVDALKHRIEDSEREKRDLIGVVSRLKEDAAQREEEIQTLRNNLRQARQEHQTLESELRELRSSDTSTKFKIETLTQQLQLAKEESERTSTELTGKTEEFAKYRRTKHAELSQLQSQYDSLTQSHSSAESTLKALQSSHSAQGHQLTQALARVQDLTGQLAEQEATFSSEAAGLRRLVSMMEERELQAKSIVEGIEKEWATVGDRAERRENALRENVERERRRADEAEKRAEQLEKVMEKMDRGELPIPGLASTPGTPMRNGAGIDLATQGMMGLSPTVAMASRAQKTGKTFTEVYADYVRLQEEYARKSAEYDHMDKTLSAVLAQIEERAPILAQQRMEYERLQSEASQLASQLAQALSERDSYSSSAQDAAQKLTKSARENDLLQKQLDDLGRQVQSLLREITRRDDASIPSEAELEQDEGTAPAENIEQVITNNLVLFRSIGGLQEQNQKLLKIVRELGAKMETEERDYREAMEKEQQEAVMEAHVAIQELQQALENQKRSSEVTIQAYMKERDALRSMLSRSEKAMGGTRRGPTVNGDIGGHGEDTGEDGHDADLAKELADVQSQFEAYKSEMGTDSVRLREELIALQRENGQLGAALAKANAKIEYLADRHRMASEQHAMQTRELDNMSKRNQQLYDQYTRIDIECNRVSEDLLAASSRVEQLRNECANLRAEKKIWESVQSRLVEENKALASERSQLSGLMANVQKMHNDLEQSGQNDRRRLENQIQMLESQTQDLRTQLSHERDSVRHVSLQREIDLKDLQARLDRTTQELSKTRESLVGAETSKKHLEERVQDISKQLRGNEEKLTVYERRTTAVNGIHHTDVSGGQEQQLQAEVAELRSALKVAEMDLTSARSHVQQFQEISQANEAALAALNATHDEYKASSEAQIAKLESDCEGLQERLRSVQEEMSQSSEKYAKLQGTFETERIAWANDKKTLEDAIIDITTSEKHSESDRVSQETEIRQLEERAKSAEDKYSREVLAHAESIKSVDGLRAQLASAHSAARDSLSAAETAQAKLTTSEASWKQQKEALDKEVADLSSRCKDLATQNGILHQHLESVSSQAARIRQAADSTTSAVTSDDSVQDADAKLSELRSVVAYLRKEKEIVDLQLELSKQENIRLKTQIDHLSQALEESRTSLSQERERAVEAATSEAQHAELVERINQLTILRESNATLRADCEAQSRRARELDLKLQQVSLELEPAKEQARVAQAELEARDQQIKRLEDESRRWQERNTQLLSKYDRIDPAEVQLLKDEIELLKQQQTAAEKSRAVEDVKVSDQAQTIQNLENSLKATKETGSKNNAIFKRNFEKWKEEKAVLEASVADLQNQIKSLTEEREAFQQTESTSSTATKDIQEQLQMLRREKEQVEVSLAEERKKVAEYRAAEANIAEQASLITTLQAERDQLLAEKDSWSSSSVAPLGDASSARQEWESEKAALVKARDDATAALKAAQDQAKKATDEAQNIRASNEKFQARLQELQKARAAEGQRARAQQEAAVNAAIEKVKTETAVDAAVPDDLAKRHADELRTLEDRLKAEHKLELEQAVAKAKEAAQPEEGEATSEAVVAAAVAAAEERLKAQHVEEIAAAVERGRMEQAAKSKLKDAQLVRSQHKVKELEAQILEWRKAGVLPEQSSATPATPAPAATATAPSTAPTVVTPPVRKPSMSVPAAPGQAELATRGRGAPRGAPRGGARGGATRGAPGRGAPAAAGAHPLPTAPAAAGMSIMGAAGKRGREDSDVATDDSLAKRLKPAETPTPKPPVTLKRDRV